MVSKDKGVQIKVGKDFFDKLFEPSRREIEKKLGVRVGQKQFSSMILKSGITFKPKLMKLFKNAPTKNSRKKR